MHHDSRLSAISLAPEQLSLFPLAVIVYDPASRRILAANAMAGILYGYPDGVLPLGDLADTVIEPERERVRCFVGTLLDAGWARSDWTMLRADGATFPATSFSCPLVWAGQPARLIAVEDRSEQVASQAALAESEMMFRQTMNAAQVGIFVLQDFRFRFANDTLCRWFGYAPEDLVDVLGPLDLIIPEERDFVLDQMRRRAAGEPGKQYVITCLRKDASTFPGTILGAPSAYRGKPASVGTLVDLTELKRAEDQIRQLAFYDGLTGLPNRTLLADRVAQALARATREASCVALLFIDLDRFKNVNDTLGHTIGDRLLHAVGIRLSAQVRKSDTLARLGGDEFVLLVVDASQEGVSEIARKLLDQFARPFAAEGHQLTVTPSVGISLFPDDGTDFESLLRSADLAMYQAKEQGRNGFRFFTQAMNDEMVERVSLEHRLRQAFEGGELALHYQPIVHIDSGEIVSVEALMRWFPEDGPPISPGRFIPVAESSGLIVALGQWAIREACRQNRAWRDAGLPPIAVGVNLSAVQFYRADFVDTVAAALAAFDLPGAALDLEITESLAMTDIEAAMQALHRLDALGIGLSIDDFGTGYSSLASLKHFPVRRIKIDRSFVADVLTNADDRTIAGTIVQMGHSLRHTVVAEGVETESQRALLAAQGGDLAQGFLFSPAVDAAQLATLLAAGRIVP